MDGGDGLGRLDCLESDDGALSFSEDIFLAGDCPPFSEDVLAGGCFNGDHCSRFRLIDALNPASSSNLTRSCLMAVLSPSS